MIEKMIQQVYQPDMWTQKYSLTHLIHGIINFLRTEDCLNFIQDIATIIDRDAGSISRTVWINPQDKNQSFLIVIYENASFAQAKDDLLDILINIQQLPLPRGPEEWGSVSFVYPSREFPAAYWILDRYLITIKSFGANAADTLECANRISKRLKEVTVAKKL